MTDGAWFMTTIMFAVMAFGVGVLVALLPLKLGELRRRSHFPWRVFSGPDAGCELQYWIGFDGEINAAEGWRVILKPDGWHPEKLSSLDRKD